MYSEGGVMATKAFDAITLTLYIGLADSWSSGGRKEDNVLAGAHERIFSFFHHNADKCSICICICDEKKKIEAFLRCCVLHAWLELS